MKTNQYDQAAACFNQALKHNPLLWEAFEGLCASGKHNILPWYLHPLTISTGNFPDIDQLFPPKSLTTRRYAGDSPQQTKVGPIATGIGFFTPDGPSTPPISGPPNWVPQPFRLDPHPRYSM